MSNYLCQTALEKQLKQWTDAQAIAVEWPNKRLVPPDDAIYLRTHFMPAMADDLFLEGGHKQYVGVYQIDVVGLANTTTGPMNAIAGQLETLFYSPLRLIESGQTLLILSPLWQGPLIDQKNRVFIPCSFNWQMDITT